MKSILISDELHQELKVYSVSNGNTVKNIVESAIRDVISAKSASVDPKEHIKKIVQQSPVKTMTHKNTIVTGNDRRPNPYVWDEEK